MKVAVLIRFLLGVINLLVGYRAPVEQTSAVRV